MAFLRNQVAYFITGLIFWLPIAIIVLISSYVFGILEELGSDFLDIFIPHRFVYTGLGVALWLLIFLITGLILKKTPVGSIFSRTPVLGVFFRQGGEVMSLDTLLTLSPCLFLYSPTCPSYGWILSEQPVKVDKEITDMMLINVYYPNVPSLVTGQVYSVRKETVMRIGNPSKEMVDILLYGFRRPDNICYLPWEDESEQDFKERSKCFGIA
ncbi:hypothetical protein ACFLTQ_01760 [Chloroflexota bacterium]